MKKKMVIRENHKVVKMNKMSKTSRLDQRGSIAIMMVITSTIILTIIMTNFSYDTSINKIKVYNIEDRAKAKLTAESGLKFAMARLRLYKEAYNYLQKNNSAKELVKQETLDTLWNFPFRYPIPQSAEMNAIQKEAINDFNDNTILHGSLDLNINNIANKINLNMIRISLFAQANKGEEEEKEKDEEENLEYNVESQLLKFINMRIEEKSQDDDFFAAEFQGLETELLVNELKYYVSDPKSIEDAAGADTQFENLGIAPKKGAFTSTTELYSLPSWPDEIVKLIENEFTVHGAIMIDLNKITDKLLKLLIPDITQEDVDEFFKYKNDEEDPKNFNSLDDFKNYIVQIGNLMTESDFDERFSKFKAQGLQFGPTPTLFKVVSAATVGRSTYTLTAFVTLPAQPAKRPEKKKEDEDEDEDQDGQDKGKDKDEDKDKEDKDKEGEDEDKKDEQKALLLNPRIVDIIIS